MGEHGIFKSSDSIRWCTFVIILFGCLLLTCGGVLLGLSFLNTLQSKLSVLRWAGILFIVIGILLILGAIIVPNIAKKLSDADVPTTYCVEERQNETIEQNKLRYIQATDVDLVTGTDMEVRENTEKPIYPYKHYVGNVRGFPGGYINKAY